MLTGVNGSVQDHGLTFARPVDRALVHKAAIAEVLITDSVRLGGDRFAIAAQWPRAHALYRVDQERFSDPMLLVESLRQASIYLSHRFHGAEQDRPFIMNSLEYSLSDHTLLQDRGAPHTVVLDGECRERRMSPNRLALEGVFEVLIDGRPCGRGRATWSVVSRSSYDALRTRSAAAVDAPRIPQQRVRSGEMLAPVRVGRRLADDVLLAHRPGGTPGSWLLQLCPEHPVLFDHGTDHIPGMVLLEAFRQAGHASSFRVDGNRTDWAVQVRAQAEFHTFAELDLPVEVRADVERTREDRLRMRLTAHQCGRLVAEQHSEWVVRFGETAGVAA